MSRHDGKGVKGWAKNQTNLKARKFENVAWVLSKILLQMYNYKWSDMVKCKRLYNFSLRNILSFKVHCHEWWVIKFLMLQRSLSLLSWQIFSWLKLFCYTENTCFVATKRKIILLKLPVLVGNLYTNNNFGAKSTTFRLQIM